MSERVSEQELLEQIIAKQHEIRSKVDFELGNSKSELFKTRLTDSDVESILIKFLREIQETKKQENNPDNLDDEYRWAQSDLLDEILKGLGDV